MRAMWIGAALLLAATTGLPVEPVAYRNLTGVDLRIFSCAPDAEFELVASPKDLARFDGSANRCDAAQVTAFRTGLLRSLEAARFDWNSEALLVVVSHYGTGMAKGRIELKTSSPGVLVAEVSWIVPPPPVTPDTATVSAVVAIRKALVNKGIARHGDAAPRVWDIPAAVR